MLPNYNPVAVRVGSGDANYFFGYYNKTNWDISGRYMLAQRVSWPEHKIEPGLVAEVGYFDRAHNDRFVVLGSTTAWNWQMGAQLQWVGQGSERVIYNNEGDHPRAHFPGLVSVVQDLESGITKVLPLPVYVVAPSGKWALSVNYHRLWITHETIGYPPRVAATPQDLYPDNDGIFKMDVETGEYSLLLSFRTLRNFHPVESMRNAIHWVSHIEINPSSNRILFLHRWTERVADETCFLHRLITAAPDGTDMRLLEDSDHPLPQLAADFDRNKVGTFDYEKSEFQISHPLWKDDRHIIVWGPHEGEIHYHLYEDAVGGEVQIVGRNILDENGHMSFSSRNGDWMVSDTYPDAATSFRELFLFNTKTARRVSLGRYFTDPNLGKENRCDLHPRWSPDGQSICIDSIHEGDRRLYVVDVSAIVSGSSTS